MDKSKVIFGNKIKSSVVRKGIKTKNKYIRKFGDDSNAVYHYKAEAIDSLNFMNVCNLVLSDTKMVFPDNALIVGNIRMGFGHYRISMAIASCANALGYKPYWFDIASFNSTGSKMIRYQNDLYSKASRISQKSKLFNHFIWEPLNCEGFRKISYNSIDQRNSELLVPLYNDLPKDIPFIATHVWPSQGAIHSSLTNVVNAIPDNWPMALHLSEGSIHTVQTPFSYLGYKLLNGMAKERLNPMSEDDLKMVGHYVDHELVSNIDIDTKRRIDRIERNEPIRFLITVGGAGAGKNLYLDMINHLIKYVKTNQACLFINFGDHLSMWDYLKNNIADFESLSTKFFNEYSDLIKFNHNLEENYTSGIYCIFNSNIFEAVYSTNLLMRNSDFLITKPSELSFYPIPKLMMRHIGGHERYGAIHASEFGDSTFECETTEKMNNMIDSLINDKELVLHLVNQIPLLNRSHVYDGGYEVVKLAVKKNNII